MNQMTGSAPESNGDENGVFHTQGAVTTIHSGERDNIGEECGTDKPIQIKPKYHPQQQHYGPCEIRQR